jgi:hypothetical protein
MKNTSRISSQISLKTPGTNRPTRSTIDLLVYELYGLTADEIAVVEGKV